jgi:DNA-binding response OmpR family regulator
VPRILLADDNGIYREACTRFLACEGYEVDQARDGDEAIRLLRKRPYDLVLLDLAMPLLDGTAVLQAMRMEPRWAQIPVIVMTALSEGDASRRVEGLEVRALLIKSRFSVKELMRHVRQAIPGAVAA